METAFFCFFPARQTQHDDVETEQNLGHPSPLCGVSPCRGLSNLAKQYQV